MFVNGFSGLSYPETPDVYGDGPYRIWQNVSNRIDIPSDFFQSALGKRTRELTGAVVDFITVIFLAEL